MRKGSSRGSRARLHAQQGEGARSVRYRFHEMPNGTTSAYVVPRARLSAQDFLERLAARNPGLSRTQAAFYLETIFGELAAALREGNTVTLGGLASFGTTIVGKVAPGQTHLNATHELRAWVRLAQGFQETVNRGAHLLPADGLPVRMEPEAITVVAPQTLLVSGRFREAGAATYTVLRPDGSETVCTLEESGASATRHESTSLTLALPFPLSRGGYTLRITYPSPSGQPTECTLSFAVEE